jgi:hypothetical protein
MNILKLSRIKSGGAYLWCKVAKNKLELRKVKDNNVVNELEKQMKVSAKGLKELPEDTFQPLRKKTYFKNKIERLQYDEKTGKEIGHSLVYPGDKNYNSSFIVNDPTVTMKKPVIHKDGRIGRREFLVPHGLVIDASNNLSPLGRRILKILVQSRLALQKKK